MTAGCNLTVAERTPRAAEVKEVAIGGDARGLWREKVVKRLINLVRSERILFCAEKCYDYNVVQYFQNDVVLIE